MAEEDELVKHVISIYSEEQAQKFLRSFAASCHEVGYVEGFKVGAWIGMILQTIIILAVVYIFWK